MENKQKRTVRSNKAQINFLCQYMAHPEFASGDYRSPMGAIQISTQWAKLKEALDELGPSRSVEQWKICWRDQKARARAEGASVKRAKDATGNIVHVPNLSDTSAQVLSAIGMEMAVGFGPEESPIGFSEPPQPSTLQCPAQSPVQLQVQCPSPSAVQLQGQCPVVPPAMQLQGQSPTQTAVQLQAQYPTQPAVQLQAPRPAQPAVLQQPQRPAARQRDRRPLPPGRFMNAQSELNNLMKGLHIFCTEDSNNIRDPHELNKSHLGASSNGANKNTNFETSPSSSSQQQQTINGNEAYTSNESMGNNDQIISQGSDMDLESIFDTPRKSALRRQLAKKIALQRKHSKKIKLLQQKAGRLKKKNVSLQKILLNLRKERFIDNDITNTLSENVFAAELYNNLVKKASKVKRPMPKYTPEFRKFCLTLHFYSPRAYNYVRKTFSSCLPHPKTIYNWYRNVSGSPGLTDEAFKLLEAKAQVSKKKLICALVADEMAIRPQNINGVFGSIRMHGGHNDNPNALQFKGSYRKLLCHMELQVGDTGNCVPLETISILTCSSALQCINASTIAERFDDADEELNNEIPIDDDITLEMASNDDPDCKNHIVGYIAGNVVKYISTRIKCQFCVDNMLSNEKQWFHKLVCLRDKGGLIYASKEVYSICSIAESSLRSYIKQNAQKCKSEKEFCLKIMVKLIGSPLFPTKEEHTNSQYHDTNLARLIVERYTRIRFFYESKKDNMSQKASSKRQLFRKQLQIQGH